MNYDKYRKLEVAILTHLYKNESIWVVYETTWVDQIYNKVLPFALCTRFESQIVHLYQRLRDSPELNERFVDTQPTKARQFQHT